MHDEARQQLAKKIIQLLKEKSSPQQSAWGNEFPDAHESLFNDYAEDLTETIKDALDGWITVLEQ